MSRDFLTTDKGLQSAFTQEKWVANAAEIFQWMDINTLKAIYACGQDEFIRNCRIGFNGQGFNTEDYRTMFHRIRFRVTKADEAEQRSQVTLHG